MISKACELNRKKRIRNPSLPGAMPGFFVHFIDELHPQSDKTHKIPGFTTFFSRTAGVGILLEPDYSCSWRNCLNRILFPDRFSTT